MPSPFFTDLFRALGPGLRVVRRPRAVQYASSKRYARDLEPPRVTPWARALPRALLRGVPPPPAPAGGGDAPEEEGARLVRAAGEWSKLMEAVKEHQRLLLESGVGLDIDPRERIKINARRSGLEAPKFFDEKDFLL